MKPFTIRQWIDLIIVPLSLIMVLFLFTVLSASAHAYLAESTPRNGEQVSAPPNEVVARFTEELETDGSSLKVLDKNGRQVDAGSGGVDLFDPEHKTMTVTLPENLPTGKYTVEWVALSLEDGDTTDGAFSFGIGTNVEAIVAIDEDTESFSQSGGEIGWWVSGGIIGLIALLLVAMLLLTKQPATTFE